MKRSPKSEIRNPKEGRSPKTEWGRAAFDGEGSRFWSWGDEPTSSFMVLHDGTPSNQQPMDLMERSARFGEAIVKFAKKIPQNAVNDRLIRQLVGSASSIGANYCEADDAVSGKEFKQKIGFSRKESKETMHFLRLIAAAEENLAPEARTLWREAKELNLIFGAIWRK